MTNKVYIITTPRLGLRAWHHEDIAPMSTINADPQVMQYFPSTLTEQQTANFILRMQKQQDERGHCYFAAELLESGQLIGFIGCAYQDYEASFTPAVDIGWRLTPEVWGRGLATEGAAACLQWCFDHLELTEIYSVAPVVNTPSIRVMEKLGMRQLDTFDHPKLYDFPTLQRCVVYHKSRLVEDIS